MDRKAPSKREVVRLHQVSGSRWGQTRFSRLLFFICILLPVGAGGEQESCRVAPLGIFGETIQPPWLQDVATFPELSFEYKWNHTIVGWDIYPDEEEEWRREISETPCFSLKPFLDILPTNDNGDPFVVEIPVRDEWKQNRESLLDAYHQRPRVEIEENQWMLAKRASDQKRNKSLSIMINIEIANLLDSLTGHRLQLESSNVENNFAATIKYGIIDGHARAGSFFDRPSGEQWYLQFFGLSETGMDFFRHDKIRFSISALYLTTEEDCPVGKIFYL